MAFALVQPSVNLLVVSLWNTLCSSRGLWVKIFLCLLVIYVGHTLGSLLRGDWWEVRPSLLVGQGLLEWSDRAGMSRMAE